GGARDRVGQRGLGSAVDLALVVGGHGQGRRLAHGQGAVGVDDVVVGGAAARGRDGVRARRGVGARDRGRGGVVYGGRGAGAGGAAGGVVRGHVAVVGGAGDRVGQRGLGSAIDLALVGGGDGQGRRLAHSEGAVGIDDVVVGGAAARGVDGVCPRRGVGAGD